MELSAHALYRFREHHPEATSAQARDAWEQGEDVSQELAAAVLCRRPQSARDHYRLTLDGRGIFVVKGEVVVTYLRLSVVATKILRPETPPVVVPVVVPVVEPVAALRTSMPKLDDGDVHKRRALTTIEALIGRKLGRMSISSGLKVWLKQHRLTKWATIAYATEQMDADKLQFKLGDVMIFVERENLVRHRLTFACRDLDASER